VEVRSRLGPWLENVFLGRDGGKFPLFTKGVGEYFPRSEELNGGKFFEGAKCSGAQFKGSFKLKRALKGGGEKRFKRFGEG